MAQKQLQVKDLLDSEDPSEMIASLSFEEGMKLLEELVQKVEGGTLPLEVSLRSYERAVALVEKLKVVLQGAEARLEIIRGSSTAKSAK